MPALAERQARHVLGGALFEQLGLHRQHTVADSHPQKKWVDRPWSGQCPSPSATWRKTLGPLAWRAWCLLCEVRDSSRGASMTGMVYSGAGWLARKLRCSVSAAERAVARLTAAHLVRPLEDPWRQVRQRDGRLVLCYQRRVYGNPKPDFAGDIRVPATSRKWLTTKPTRGGARIGAGRKPNSKPRDPEFKAEDNLPSGEQELSNTLSGVDKRAAEAGAVDPFQGGAGAEPDPNHTSALPVTAGGGGEGEVPASQLTAALTAGGLLAQPAAGTGAQVFYAAVPHPGHHVVPPAVVPNPPKIPADLSELAAVERLLAAYRGAVKKLTGKDPMVLAKRGAVEKSSLYPALVRAVTELRAFEIAPAAWASWSCAVWSHYASSKAKVPPLSWAFSDVRLHEHHGWFENDGGNMLGGTIIVSPAARELCDRYRSMRLEMAWATSVEQMQAIAARIFPPGLYERLVAQAKDQTAETQASLDRAVANGAWIW